MTQEKWIDCYKILEIDPTATDEEIKKAYRRLSKEYHPDLNKEHEEEYEEKFKEINNAYDILKKNRKEYDRTYESYKNGNYNDENNNSYQTQYANSTQEKDFDEVKKDYTEAEQEAAKREALKVIIENTLKKVDEILISKKEIMYENFLNRAFKDPIEYFNIAKEFINIVYDYIMELNELKEEAIKYDLLEEYEKIDTTIEFLENDTNSFPLTLTDLDFNIKKEEFINMIENNLQELMKKKDSILNDYKNVKICLADKTIKPYEYKNILQELKLETTSYLTELKSYYKDLSKLNLSKYEKNIAEIISTLNTEMSFFPNNYKDAMTMSSRESFSIGINDIKDKVFDTEKWLIKLARIMAKYPSSYRINTLYEKMVEVIKDLIGSIKVYQKTMFNLERYFNDDEDCNIKYSQKYLHDLNVQTKNLWNDLNKMIKMDGVFDAINSDEPENIKRYNKVLFEKVSGKETEILEKRIELLTLLLEHKNFEYKLEETTYFNLYKNQKQEELSSLEVRVELLKDFIEEFIKSIKYQQATDPNISTNSVGDVDLNEIDTYLKKAFGANITSDINVVIILVNVLVQVITLDFNLTMSIISLICSVLAVFERIIAKNYKEKAEELTEAATKYIENNTPNYKVRGNVATPTEVIDKLEKTLNLKMHYC